MKQKITSIVLLLIAFFCLNIVFGANKRQGEIVDSVAIEEIQQDATIADSVPPPAPRIRYRDVINQLTDSVEGLNQNIKSIYSKLDALTKENELLRKELAESDPPSTEPIIEEKEKRSLLGIRLSADLYNFILSFLFVSAIIALAIAFFYCKRASMCSKEKEMQYKELLEEFENYRKSSRERFEKQAIDHFNELKKLGKR